ncbi:hypothetical protein PVAG01_10415 [Phlyctema vagabunda]|uniref:Ras-associating domain-containing protein n=1 Tax=Phlyctema vagabunda TaxID=108571 RepID=A0ABR4P5V5_9HELO
MQVPSRRSSINNTLVSPPGPSPCRLKALNMSSSIAELLKRCADVIDPGVPHNFGVEYDQLCTELRLQWLRIRLCAQSANLSLAHGMSDNSILLRPDIHPTITPTVNCMISLLTQIESIRTKYGPQDLSNDYSSSMESLDCPGRKCGSTNGESSQGNTRGQKKSLLSKAKWVFRDARKFKVKLNRLTGYVDALESVTRLAHLTHSTSSRPTSSRPTSSRPASSGETLPPYSIRRLMRNSSSTGHHPIPNEANPNAIFHRNLAARRYGCVFPPDFDIFQHVTPSMRNPTREMDPPRPPFIYSVLRSNDLDIQLCHMTMNDTTQDLLPRILARFKVQHLPEQFALFIDCESFQRRLSLTESPLAVLTQLRAQGHKPNRWFRLTSVEAGVRGEPRMKSTS